MKEYINNFKRFIMNDNKDIKIVLEENGFSIIDIYDIENIKGHVDAIKLNGVVSNFCFEGIDFELDNPGGIIIFSTDLNSTLGNAETFIDKVKFFFDSKWKTILNRLNVSERLRKILLNKYKLVGYTLGKNYTGFYTSKNGLSFNEKSFTIDIAGVDSDALVLIASEICREFKQESVMVRDFNYKDRPKVYFVNDKDKK
jgi:hypothetical protein